MDNFNVDKLLNEAKEIASKAKDNRTVPLNEIVKCLQDFAKARVRLQRIPVIPNVPKMQQAKETADLMLSAVIETLALILQKSGYDWIAEVSMYHDETCDCGVNLTDEFRKRRNANPDFGKTGPLGGGLI